MYQVSDELRTFISGFLKNFTIREEEALAAGLSVLPCPDCSSGCALGCSGGCYGCSGSCSGCCQGPG